MTLNLKKLRPRRTALSFLVAAAALACLAWSSPVSAQTVNSSHPLIVVTRLSAPSGDTVAEQLSSTITSSLEIVMRLTGSLEVRNADFLTPTLSFNRSLEYYRQVGAAGAVFGSVRPAHDGAYTISLDIWNATKPNAKPTTLTRTVTDLLSSFSVADQISLRAASTIVGHKLEEGTLVVSNLHGLGRYSVYADGNLLGRNHSEYRVLTGKHEIVVAKPGMIGDVPVEAFHVDIKQAHRTTVMLKPLFAASSSATRNTLRAVWARTSTGSPGNASYDGIVTDKAGNVYVIGSISGTSTYTFGNGVKLNGAINQRNAILVKYDSDGVAKWARTVTYNTDPGYGVDFKSIALASDGSIYVVGDITGNGTFGFGNSVFVHGVDTGANPLLIKFTPSGSPLWAKTVTNVTGPDTGSFTSAGFNAVSIDNSGSLYAAGFTYGTDAYSFGNGVVSEGTDTHQGGNFLLVKYDASGDALWARTVIKGQATSPPLTGLGEGFSGVAVDNSGNVYAAGHAWEIGVANPQPIGFGNGVAITPSGSEAAVLVKYAPDGEPRWARGLSAAGGGSQFNSVTVGPKDNIYAGGSLYGDTVYHVGNGVTVKSNGYCPKTKEGSSAALLVRYETSGSPLWARTVTVSPPCSTIGSFFNDVLADQSGNVVVIGSDTGSTSFNFGNRVTIAGTAKRATNHNVLLAKYDASGTCHSAVTLVQGEGSASGYGGAVFNAAAIGRGGNIYSVGTISGSQLYGFGNGVVTKGTARGNNTNVLVIKYQ